MPEKTVVRLSPEVYRRLVTLRAEMELKLQRRVAMGHVADMAVLYIEGAAKHWNVEEIEDFSNLTLAWKTERKIEAVDLTAAPSKIMGRPGNTLFLA